jgi:hypothetical protein
MNFINFEWLKGKKTYIVVAFTVIAIFLENYVGIDLPGFQPSADWVNDVLALLGIGTLRAGVSKVQAK